MSIPLSFQGNEEVSLTHVKTVPIPLSASLFTVMPSGALVFWGKAAATKPHAVHCYIPKALGKYNYKDFPATCEHVNVTEILGIKVGTKELLAVSCYKCQTITLLNIETGTKSLVFKDHEHFLGMMCQGEEGEMFVVGHNKLVSNILHLDCSTAAFKLLQVIPTENDECSALTYIPRHRLVAVTYTLNRGGIEAVSVDSRKTMWKANGKSANSLVYSAELNVLIAADTLMIKILRAPDGTLAQVLPLRLDVTWLGNMSLRKDRLICHLNERDGEKVVFCQVGTEPSHR